MNHKSEEIEYPEVMFATLGKPMPVSIIESELEMEMDKDGVWRIKVSTQDITRGQDIVDLMKKGD